MKIRLFSFGFKYGCPEANMLLDVRFLPNPYWVPELKERSGLEEPVAAYVLESQAGRELLARVEPLLAFMLDSHRQVGREEFSCAVGCTGGRHRSVAVTEHLRQFVAEAAGSDTLEVFHRDIGRTDETTNLP
ncbi:MAG: RapZ C-terminal domain-containing protein [Candidatus Electronema sp. V4]|uniref:RapZ C-terminal domain-containing protein n=1 Tax=Candidatus Electronema sp. V4 TaxID=3454756 RepID=UPI00405547B7